LDHFEERFSKIFTDFFVKRADPYPVQLFRRSDQLKKFQIRVHNTGTPNITFGWSELLKILGCVLQLSGQGRKPVPGNQLHPLRVQGQAKVPNQ
jgi:hypothetical protein